MSVIRLPKRGPEREQDAAFTYHPDAETHEVSPVLAKRIRRTIAVGLAVTLVCVVGLGLWAALSPVTGAVAAPGVVRVEGNRKSVKRLDPGTVERILVREGQRVEQDQLLFVFSDTTPRAQLEIVQAAHDNASAERARFEAEARGAGAVAFPAELVARRNDPQVAAILDSQRSLFEARRIALRGQQDIGRQRIQQLSTQIGGMRAQVSSIDSQQSLVREELNGLNQLYEGGYAPKTRLLALQRSSASLGGTRGEQVAAIGRAQEAIGETRLQMLAAQQARTSEAAAGLEQAQAKLAELGPRLVAAKEALERTEVRAPAAGYVLNLTQFTQGGAVSAGEPLLDIVPNVGPLIVQAQIRPQDAHAVRQGLKAKVTLTGFNTRTTPQLNATVTNVAADASTDSKTGIAYFSAQLSIPQSELQRLPEGARLYAGMPVSTSIVTGTRSVMDYLVGPIFEVFRGSLHES